MLPHKVSDSVNDTGVALDGASTGADLRVGLPGGVGILTAPMPTDPKARPRHGWIAPSGFRGSTAARAPNLARLRVAALGSPREARRQAAGCRRYGGRRIENVPFSDAPFRCSRNADTQAATCAPVARRKRTTKVSSCSVERGPSEVTVSDSASFSCAN